MTQEQDAKTASNNTVYGWSSWGSNWYNTHVGPTVAGPHENIVSVSVPIGNPVDSDPMTVANPGGLDTIYTTSRTGSLSKISWNAPGTALNAVNYGSPGLPCSNNASTPAMSAYGRVHYALNGGYLATFDTNTLTFGPHYDLGGALTNRFTSPEAGAMDGWSSTSPIIYVQGADGFYIISTDSEYYDDHFSWTSGVNCCGLFNHPGYGVPQYVVTQENSLGGTLINCWLPAHEPGAPREWRMTSDPLQASSVRNCITMIDTGPFYWYGDCLVVTDHAFYYVAKDPEQDVHELPWRLIVFDCEEILQELGAFVSSAALVYAHGGLHAFVMQLEYTHGPQPYHYLRLVAYTVNPVTKSLNPWWSSDALEYAGGGHTTPALDPAGYAYVTATVVTGLSQPGGQPVINNVLHVYDPWAAFDPYSPRYTSVLSGSNIQSSPSLGSDGRVYVTTDAGYLHAFYEP